MIHINLIFVYGICAGVQDSVLQHSYTVTLTSQWNSFHIFIAMDLFLTILFCWSVDPYAKNALF
jgi:hypothetical protein